MKKHLKIVIFLFLISILFLVSVGKKNLYDSFFLSEFNEQSDLGFLAGSGVELSYIDTSARECIDTLKNTRITKAKDDNEIVFSDNQYNIYRLRIFLSNENIAKITFYNDFNYASIDVYSNKKKTSEVVKIETADLIKNFFTKEGVYMSDDLVLAIKTCISEITKDKSIADLCTEYGYYTNEDVAFLSSSFINQDEYSIFTYGDKKTNYQNKYEIYGKVREIEKDVHYSFVLSLKDKIIYDFHVI